MTTDKHVPPTNEELEAWRNHVLERQHTLLGSKPTIAELEAILASDSISHLVEILPNGTVVDCSRELRLITEVQRLRGLCRETALFLDGPSINSDSESDYASELVARLRAAAEGKQC